MWRYYLDVTKFALAVYILSAVLVNPVTAALVFGIFGTGLGLIGFSYFHKNEYYTYFNLGFTRRKLVTVTWLVNAVLCIPLMGLGLLIAMLF